jgi:lantibiotic modifying enzyme
MEYIPRKACDNLKSGRRFYERLGGTVAAAYLLGAVDCHRENIVICGEHPVLVDAEGLFYPLWPRKRKRDFRTRLLATGFIARKQDVSASEDQTSMLNPASSGDHLPRIGTKVLGPAKYEKEILRGFVRVWRCASATRNGQSSLRAWIQRRVQPQLRSIHWPSVRYDAIRRKSITPAALRLWSRRRLMITQLCRSAQKTTSVIELETAALEKFEIPYFERVATPRRFREAVDPLPDLRRLLRDHIHQGG